MYIKKNKNMENNKYANYDKKWQNKEHLIIN